MTILKALTAVVLYDLRYHRVAVAVGVALGVSSAFAPLNHPQFHLSHLLGYLGLVVLIYYGRATDKQAEGRPARGGSVGGGYTEGPDY